MSSETFDTLWRPENWSASKIIDNVLAKHYPEDCSLFGETINKFFIEASADDMLEATMKELEEHWMSAAQFKEFKTKMKCGKVSNE